MLVGERLQQKKLSTISKNSMESKETSRVYYAWVARDKRGALRLFDKRPLRLRWFGEWTKCLIQLNPEDFPEITWENSPQKVELIMKITN